MKLTVMGCSPAWPNPGGAHSGYLVQSGSRRLLLDCGGGVLARLRELDGGDWPRVDAIVLSHWHHDHWGDLVSWSAGNRHGPGRGREQPELWLPPPGRSQIEDFGAQISSAEMFGEAFRIREYEEGVPFEAAGFRIVTVAVPHYIWQSYAARVTGGERTLVYSADSGPCAPLVELARDADLFVCEAAIVDGEKDWDPRTHLALDETIELFRQSGAKRLLVTHRPFELARPDGYELAHDGLEIEI